MAKVFILWSWIGTKADDSQNDLIQRRGSSWFSHDGEVSLKRYYSQLMLEVAMHSLNPLW